MSDILDKLPVWARISHILRLIDHKTRAGSWKPKHPTD